MRDPAAPYSKTVAIVQSNYIPWKGYMDLIGLADEFILYDDAQFTRRDWRNRNRIKTPDGLKWLTIPIDVKNKYTQRIKDTRVSDHMWRRHHFRAIEHHYARARYFREYRPCLEQLYLGSDELFLSEINHQFLKTLCGLLRIHTRLSRSMDYTLPEGKTEKLVALCRQAGATEYLSGPAAKCYLDESLMAQAGIAVRWMEYSDYPEYEQFHPPFRHDVSILDLLFHMGPKALDYLKCSSKQRSHSGLQYAPLPIGTRTE